MCVCVCGGGGGGGVTCECISMMVDKFYVSAQMYCKLLL